MTQPDQFVKRYEADILQELDLIRGGNGVLMGERGLHEADQSEDFVQDIIDLVKGSQDAVIVAELEKIFSDEAFFYWIAAISQLNLPAPESTTEITEELEQKDLEAALEIVTLELRHKYAETYIDLAFILFQLLLENPEFEER